jgi:hypothetical protein
MEIKTADEVIQMIAEVLAQAEGTFIEKIANQVLTQNVEYIEDSQFVINREQEF